MRNYRRVQLPKGHAEGEVPYWWILFSRYNVRDYSSCRLIELGTSKNCSGGSVLYSDMERLTGIFCHFAYKKILHRRALAMFKTMAEYLIDVVYLPIWLDVRVWSAFPFLFEKLKEIRDVDLCSEMGVQNELEIIQEPITCSLFDKVVDDGRRIVFNSGKSEPFSESLLNSFIEFQTNRFMKIINEFNVKTWFKIKCAERKALKKDPWKSGWLKRNAISKRIRKLR